MQSHPTAIGLRNKQFPYLEDLSIVFGKDRATGAGAETPADAVEQIDENEAKNIIEIDDGQDDFMDPISLTQPPNHNQSHQDDNSQKQAEEGVGPSRKAKRRRSGGISEDMVNDNFAETMAKLGNYFEESNNNVAKLVGCFQFMADDAQRKLKISEELMKIEGLSDSERIRATMIISQDSTKTNGFFTFATHMRIQYVKMVLNGEI